VYGPSGSLLASPEPVVEETDPVSLSITMVFTPQHFPVGRDYRLEMEVSGTLADESAALVRLVRPFDVTRSPLPVEVTWYDLKEADPRVGYNLAITTASQAAPYIMLAHQALCGRLKTLNAYPDQVIDRDLWRRCLLYQSLSLLFDAFGQAEAAHSHQIHAEEAWLALTRPLATGDRPSQAAERVPGGRLSR